MQKDFQDNTCQQRVVLYVAQSDPSSHIETICAELHQG